MIRLPAATLLLSTLLGLAGCTTTSLFSGDRVDYRSASVKTNPLEVPPDLTQLSREGRYQTQSGPVSASELPPGGVTRTRAKAPTVAPVAIGDFKVERDGARRWISVPKPPEQVWPQLVAFWQDLGFTLVKNDPAAGVLETNWAENRAKLPQDIVRKTLGSVLDSLYSTGEMDQYRTRVERTATGSEIFVTHKGMEEVYITPQKDLTSWQSRPPDEQMESEMLTRMLVKLGATETAARTAVANPVTAAPAPERARIVASGPGAALEVDDSIERAWRRVGLALDRSGFTVEDRDRAAGLYFVRYVDPKTAGKDADPGFIAKLFGGSGDSSGAALKYQVALKSSGGKTLVSVLNSQGAPDSSENSKRIAAMLATELK